MCSSFGLSAEIWRGASFSKSRQFIAVYADEYFSFFGGGQFFSAEI